MSVEIPRIKLPGKPKYIKLAEDIDFFELFKKVEREFETCFLLESLGDESHVSRYSLIGFDPTHILTARENILIMCDTHAGTFQEYQTENAYLALRNVVPQNIISKKYAGGLTGFLSYDAMNYFESSLDVQKHPDFEPFKFGVYKDGLVLDKMTGEVSYYYFEESRFEFVKEISESKSIDLVAPKVQYRGDTMTREEHAAAVDKVKKDIVDGLIFQCEVGFKSLYEIDGSKLAIYQRLREVNPSPHMYYLKFGEQVVLGASPELLFRLRKGDMETFPLAGTTRRGTTPQEDTQLARTLLNDPKEIAEHNMLVDLHRNDLGRVSQFGTVKVRSLMDVKRFSHVQHISSEITGIIAENEDMFSALAANFPAGTLTGAPKIEAMKIIDGLEKEGRGPYGAAVGEFNFNGDCAFCIPIRSLFTVGKKGYAQTCGGNVYDSNAEGEYLEIQRKLAAMKKVLMEFE